MHIGCMDGYLFHREGSANCIHVGCMVVPFSIPAFCIVGIIGRVLLHAHGMYGRALPSIKKESQKGSGYTSTSGQLEAIADNSRSTALQSS